MKTGALYIRVSTDDQVEYSPESQIKLGLKYAKEHEINIPKEFIFSDEGISGKFAKKRPSFMAMISIAKRNPKPFDCILVYSFSRFARNREESISYKSLLRKKLGIEVISITQPLSEGKESVLMEALFEAMDEYYSLDLAENSIRGKLEKASRGEHQGNPPYGYIYNKNTKRLEIDEDKAKIVRFIFNEFINDSELRIKRIAQKLNTKGIKTTRGLLWVDRNIDIILHNPAYIGKIRFTEGGMKRDWENPNIKYYDGIHPPIIEKEIFDKAQELLAKRKEIHKRYTHQNTKTDNWLRGLLYCSSCGSILVKTSVKGKQPYYQCNGYAKGKCKISHYIKEITINNSLLDIIKKVYTDKIDINITYKKYNEFTDEIKLIQSQLKKIDSKLLRIKEAFQNGIDTIEEYRDNKHQLSKEKADLESQLKKLNIEQQNNQYKETVYKKCEDAYNLLTDSKTNEATKYIISHELFEKIVYNRLENTLIITYK